MYCRRRFYVFYNRNADDIKLQLYCLREVFMSAFSVWALGVAGIATLGVIVDILLPKGRMHNYVKSMFSLFTVFVIIYPIPGLIKNGFDFSEFFGSEITEDAAYTDVSENYLKNEFERAVEKHLLSEGVEARVTVYGNITAEGADINYIYVKVLLIFYNHFSF